MLSRNKTIKLLHSLTNDSYKKCRVALKANNWDINRVLFPELYALSDTVTTISESFKQVANVVAEALNNIAEAFNNIAEALNNKITPIANAIDEAFSEAEGLEQDV
jgi:hypothetical protein